MPELVVTPMPVTVRDAAWEVISEETVTVSTTAIGITTALLTDPVKTVARLTVNSNAIRAAVTADPTATTGLSIQQYQQFEVTGPNDLRKLRMIREGSSDAKVFVQLGRR